MMTGKSESEAAALFTLTVLKGRNTGKSVDLEANREYVIGRSEECDICIDPSDKMVSRKHVLLKVETNNIILENLSRTNPVQVKGKPVTRLPLKPKNKFQLGETVFILQTPAAASTSFKPDKKMLVVAGLITLSMLLLVILLTGKKDSGHQPLSVTRPAPGDSNLSQSPSADNDSDISNISGMNVSARDREKAGQHFRQGLFFYDTGNILRAVDEWERALSLNPEHADARLWFLKAERELEEAVKDHYQKAIIHHKYMRYDQALYEFKMVVELSRNKNSDQYKSALRYIDELRNR